jgi:hypothetical protein
MAWIFTMDDVRAVNRMLKPVLPLTEGGEKAIYDVISDVASRFSVDDLHGPVYRTLSNKLGNGAIAHHIRLAVAYERLNDIIPEAIVELIRALIRDSRVVALSRGHTELYDVDVEDALASSPEWWRVISPGERIS